MKAGVLNPVPLARHRAVPRKAKSEGGGQKKLDILGVCIPDTTHSPRLFYTLLTPGLADMSNTL